MRKHQEGYVLVYVMVAIVLLSLLGAVSCEIAVKNLKAQRATIDRLQDEYAAEGVIEKFCAEIEGSDYSGGETKYADVDAIKTEFTKKFKETDENPPLEDEWNNSVDISWKENTQNKKYTATITMKLKGEEGSSKVKAEVKINFVLELTSYIKYIDVTNSETGETEQKPDGYTYTYTVTVGSPTYTSYTHTTVEGDAGDEGDTTPTSEDEPLSADAQNVYAAINGHVYGNAVDFTNATAATAQGAAYSALPTQLGGYQLTWPDKSEIAWTTSSTTTIGDTTTTCETATPTVHVTDAGGNTTTLQLKLTRKTFEQTTKNQTLNGSTYGETDTTNYACAITVGESPTVDELPQSDATIHVTKDVNGNLQFTSEGEIHLTVGESHEILLTLGEEVTQKQARKQLNNATFTDQTGTVECNSLTVTGKSAGKITLTLTVNGCELSIPVSVYEG